MQIVPEEVCKTYWILERYSHGHFERDDKSFRLGRPRQVAHQTGIGRGAQNLKRARLFRCAYLVL